MNHSKRKRLRRQCEALRQQFAQAGRAAWARVLPTKEIEQVVMAEVGACRERIYPPLTTLSLFIGQVLSADGACQDAVGRRLSERVSAGQSECSLNTGPYCKARERLPLSVPKRLQELIGRRLEAQAPSTWRWGGRKVKLFDGTTVSMPDTASNQKVFPQPRGQTPGLGFPVARIGALIGLASSAVLAYAVAACEGKGSGEQALLRQLQPFIEPGDIILADALHATWWTIAAMQRAGADVLMPQHGSRQTGIATGTRLGPGDHRVAWPRPPRPEWMDRESYAALPMQLWVREVAVSGRVLVTTLEHNDVSPPALDALYRLRWNIEVDFRTIKACMGMDVLRCKSSDMVEKEIVTYLLAYNLVRLAMATAAAIADILPRTLSFLGAKRILEIFRDDLRHHPKQRSGVIGIVLGAIASLVLPERPPRVEPRAKKRRPKPLPLLMQSRQLAREQILARQP